MPKPNISKGGGNDEYQIKERPPDPAPIPKVCRVDDWPDPPELPEVGDKVPFRRLLQRVLNHYRTMTRWPCIECGRPGPRDRLRFNTVTTVDGKMFEMGCSRCNADFLLDEIDKALR